MFSLHLTLRAFRLRDENKALGKRATWRWEQSANTIRTGLYLNTDPETAVNVDDLSHTPRLCACFLWCLRSSSPDLIFPALWEASRGSHTPPETDNNTHKQRAWLEQECACTLKLTWLRFTCCISKTCNKCLWACLYVCVCVSLLLACSEWYSCALWPPWLPISWPPCSDCAPLSSPTPTPADDSNIPHTAAQRHATAAGKHTKIQCQKQQLKVCNTQRLLIKLKKATLFP